MAEREGGFSLIEILVVIVIIAILASLAIPIFLNQRERAWNTQSESALKNAATAMQAAAVTTGGSYADITIAQLVTEEGLKYSRRVTRLDVESANNEGFCLSVDHLQADNTLYWDSGLGHPDPTDCSADYP